VWDQAVHEHYEENCHYFLVRVKHPDRALMENLVDPLKDAQVTPSAVYLLFGFYDALIRMWATRDKRERFVRLLTKDPGLIQEIREFLVTDIEYRWVKEEKEEFIRCSNAAVKENEELIKVVYEDDVNGILTLDDPRLIELKEAHIIHVIEDLPKPYFKFYITLSPILGGKQPGRGEIERLIHDFIDKNQYLKKVSIYHGIGFADHMIKAVVTKYDDILTCIRQLIGEHDLGKIMRPTTYLIAERPKESEHIDIEWFKLSKDYTNLMTLVGLLEPRSAHYVRKLETEERNLVEKLVREFHSLINTSFRPIFINIFAAYLKKDTILLGETLVFLFELEVWLRIFLVDLCQRHFGDNWADELKRIMGDDHPDLSKDARTDYSLSNIVTVLSRLASEEAMLRTEIDEALEMGWEQKLMALIEYRNAFALGHIVGNPEHVGQKWANLARVVFEVGGIYDKFARIKPHDER